jgi:multidrug efflux pump
VIAQADAQFRDDPEDITDVKVRSESGQMVPVGTVVTVNESYGPDPVIRYNGYPAADIVGEADPRLVSSSEVIAKLSELAPAVLGNGFGIEWTDLSYEQTTQGNAAIIVFPLAVLLVFLVLAALYESWVLPLAVILIVPLSVLAALAGVWFTGGDINIFVQVGLVVLMGLACKNAILIVEFARELEREGMGLARAAITACKLRLRPIIMTSVAFIAGVVPLIISSGAGAEVREVMGVTVFSGMIGVTLFGLVMTPVFYVVLRKYLTREGNLKLTKA